nr:sulfite exporter TauE/SafE family protein 2-like isoform X1 [Ipomoea batatas]
MPNSNKRFISFLLFKKMARPKISKWLILLLVLLACNFSTAKETQPITETSKLQQFLSSVHQWRNRVSQSEDGNLKLGAPMVLVGILCFIAATISSAGGIGGGGLYVPILTIVAGFNLKTSSSFSAFMVTGGIIANVVCNMCVTNPKRGGKILIDFDIALLSEPCMLLGVTIGVICNVVFPEWLITALFAVFLAWCTTKTFKSGVSYWKQESQGLRRCGSREVEKGLLEEKSFDGNEGAVLKDKGNCRVGIPWTKFGMLFVIWFCFFVLYILRGNRYGKGIIPLETCGVGYWLISSLQIPLAVIFTAWILFAKESSSASQEQEEAGEGIKGLLNRLVFPMMAFLAGLLGGVFGIGGGMLISPLLIQVGIAPEITSATCSFMVFFSSTMSAVEYLLLGMEQVNSALILSSICFVASLIGLVVVQRAIEKHGRASLIVFSVGTVMALSTVLITSFGVIDVWEDYRTGKYMGFKPPC